MPGLLSNCDWQFESEQHPLAEGIRVASSMLDKSSAVHLPPLDIELHDKQQIAFESVATEQLYGGAAGGGKSHLMRVAAISWAAAIPGLQVYIFRRISDDLWKNHMEGPTGFPTLLSRWITAGLVRINFSRNSIDFKFNGSKIYLCHCQYENDRYKYLGAEIHVLLIDELTTFTKTIYTFLRSRVRLGGLKIPERFVGQFPRILCGTNPGNVGHNWVKEMFVSPKPALEVWKAPREDGGMFRQFIPALLDDNPTLASDPDYAAKLLGLGSEYLVKAMLEGNWDIVAGGMFDDIWDPNRHVVEATAVPDSWRIDRTFDYGSSRPFSVCWWAESDGTNLVYPDGRRIVAPRGTVFLVAEWYGWDGKEPNKGSRMLMREVARGIRDREQTMVESGFLKHMPQAGAADSAIFTHEDGHCIANEMALVGIKWTEANKSPGSRIAGWEAMRRRFKAAHTRPMEEPGLLVFDTCRQFIRTIPVLPRDERNPDDVDTDAEDHIGDATRYRLVAPSKRVGAGQLF